MITLYLKISDRKDWNYWVRKHLQYWLDGAEKLNLPVIINKGNFPENIDFNNEFIINNDVSTWRNEQLRQMIENCWKLDHSWDQVTLAHSLAYFYPETEYSINIDADDSRHWLPADELLRLFIETFDKINANVLSYDVYMSRLYAIHHHWSFGVCMARNSWMKKTIIAALTATNRMDEQSLSYVKRFVNTTKMARNLDWLMDWYLNLFTKEKYIACVTKYGDYIHSKGCGNFRYDPNNHALLELAYQLPRTNTKTKYSAKWECPKTGQKKRIGIFDNERLLWYSSLSDKTYLIDNHQNIGYINDWIDPFLT